MAQLHKHVSWWWELMSSNNYNKLTMFVVTILVLILAILWHKIKLSYFSNGAPLPPGPISLPIVGYLPFLDPNLHTHFTDIGQTYGPIFKLYLGSKLHVVINSVELAKVVVTDQDEVFSDRDQTIAALALSHGGQDVLFANNNSNWRKLRKIFLHEILRNKDLGTSASFRRDEVRKTIKSIFSKIGSEVNICDIALSTETDVLTQMVFKNTYDRRGEYSNLIAQINTEVSNITEILGRVNFSDFFPGLARFDLQGIERDMKKQVKKLEQILTSIAEDRIMYNSKKQHQGEKDFLQTLLDHKDEKDGTSLSTIQINSLLLDVMIAGTLTSTRLIEWTMATILKHHKVMKRVQEELAEIVGQNNIVEESHIPKLQYLNATVKETLRLYPVGPFIVPRASSKECTLGGFTIPKGCVIILNAWSIHRDPRYWDNPLEFNPERFLAGKWDYNGTNLKFFPFGSRRRLCPGVSLAEKMVMFFLASLLHSFDWSLPKGEEHDLNGKFGFTLKKTKPLIALPSQRLPDVRLYM